jgi:6-methylsalicylate decarboxylase
LATEPPYEVQPGEHDPAGRAARALSEGLNLVLLAPSSPIGLEFLPPREAEPLLEAYHEGALALEPPFGAWATACLSRPDPAAVERELRRGFVGLALPATALLDADGYASVAPLLDVLQAADQPLFVHPGPASPAGPGAPGWWAAVVSYVQQMHAAWFAFRAHGRRRHPRLRVCFALLAGLAPLHGERFAARAGERSPVDGDVFLDVSSYGTRAVDATVRVLGIDGLVNGSDRPYASPAQLDLGVAATAATRLLNSKGVPNGRAVTSGA